MRIYIAGPMTGVPEFNWQAFEEAEQRLAAAGWTPVNPHRLHFTSKAELLQRHDELTHSEYMRADVAALARCDGVLALDGWDKSKGATMELKLALELGIPTYRFNGAGMEPLELAGVKFDGAKDRWDLLPWAETRDIVRVLTFGAGKYADNNWQQVPDPRARYFAAAQRHLFAWYYGEPLDPETGISHLAHANCCLLFLAWFDNHKEPEQ